VIESDIEEDDEKEEKKIFLRFREKRVKERKI